MDFPKILRRKPAPCTSFAHSAQHLVLSPRNADANFSFNETGEMTKAPSGPSFSRIYPQTMRSNGNDYSADASHFFDFIKRMGRNDSSRTAFPADTTLNSRIKGFRSTNRRVETEGNQSKTSSVMPLKIEEVTSRASDLATPKQSAGKDLRTVKIDTEELHQSDESEL